MAWGRVQAASGTSSTGGLTFGVAFTTSNIVAGNRIIVVASIWNAPATTVTSVTDTAGNTYVLDKRLSVSDNTDITLWSAPITVGAGTKPTVTLHASGTNGEWALEIFEYSGLASGGTGYLDGTAGTATAVAGATLSSGATSPVPGASNELAVGAYGDGGNNTTITVGAGWSNFLFTGASSAVSEVAFETQNSTSGTGSNASFGVNPTGNPAGALAAVYKLAAAVAIVPFPARQALRRILAIARARTGFVISTQAQPPPPAIVPFPAREILRAAAAVRRRPAPPAPVEQAAVAPPPSRRRATARAVKRPAAPPILGDSIIWTPTAGRRRAAARLVRRVQVPVIPAQVIVAAPAWVPTAFAHRAVLAWPRRRQGPAPVPAQIILPAPLWVPAPGTHRLPLATAAARALRRAAPPPLAGADLAVVTYVSRRRPPPSVRRAAQGVPLVAQWVPLVGRRTLPASGIRRTRLVPVIPTQVVIVPAYVPFPARQSQRAALPAPRARTVLVIPAQVVVPPPPWVPGAARRMARPLIALRRGFRTPSGPPGGSSPSTVTNQFFWVYSDGLVVVRPIINVGSIFADGSKQPP